jgi:hypothetical protein
MVGTDEEYVAAFEALLAYHQGRIQKMLADADGERLAEAFLSGRVPDARKLKAAAEKRERKRTRRLRERTS